MTNTWTMPRGSGDHWAEDYARGRPGWPPQVVEISGLTSSAQVLELGAGTGKLTELLVHRFSQVVALEPAAAMRRLLARYCRAALVIAGTAQDIALADGTVDAVFAAESFHWFDDKAALTEIARVLRPRGALVMMWNLPAGPWHPDTGAIERLLTELRPRPDAVAYPLDLGGPRFVSGEWRDVFVGSSFEPLQEMRMPNDQTLDREGLVAFFASMGWIGDFPDAIRLPLLERIRSLLAANEYTREWETRLYWTRLSG